MRILIVSFYYEPDLSACSFRTAALVRALKNKLSPSDSIDVVTTMPNRYSSFKIEMPEIHETDNILIRRIKIPSHRSGFADQARAFFVYFARTLRFVKSREYDVVFATSSRLFTAFLGAIISKRKRIPLYLDIRDIFLDTLGSILRKSRILFFIPFLRWIEKYTLGSTEKVNLVSRGFEDYFRLKYPKKYTFFTNGIDEEFIKNEGEQKAFPMGGKVVFTYSGNIGDGQGLEKIVPQVVEKYKNIEFCIVGSGGKSHVLRDFTSHMENVKILPPVSRKDLISYYEKSDVLFLQLNDYDAFKKVLPSKIFEYGAMCKPIIAGVDGYAKEFLEEYLPDSMIFHPCDIVDFSKKYEKFNGRVNMEARKNFISKFAREKIMDDMAADLVAFAGEKK